jgi:hypothetical protein
MTPRRMPCGCPSRAVWRAHLTLVLRHQRR